jgi:hypothetical protein
MDAANDLVTLAAFEGKRMVLVVTNLQAQSNVGATAIASQRVSSDHQTTFYATMCLTALGALEQSHNLGRWDHSRETSR